MQLVLLIGPPDASPELAAELIAAHPLFAPLPPGRLLTALAHVGIEANIDRAPYDHILAGPAQRQFLGRVEGALSAWSAACRAYLDALLGALPPSDAPYLLDTAPEYARLWPFVERLALDTPPVLLLRNPVATAAEVLTNPADPRADGHLLESWRQQAAIIRGHDDALPVLRYENLLRAPEPELTAMTAAFGGDWPVRPETVPAIDAAAEADARWPQLLAGDSALRRRVRNLLERLPARDLHTLGYTWSTAWEPVARHGGETVRPRAAWMACHSAAHKVQSRARAFVAARPGLEAKVRKLKLACDVLLRE